MNQLGGVDSVVGKDGDADAGADVEGHALALHGRFQSLLQAPGKLCHRTIGMHRGQEDGKLVAAQAGDHVGSAQRRLEAFGDLLQHQVADVMAEGVVDFLEPVEVENHKGKMLARA